MSARSDLKAELEPHAPDEWEIFAHPIGLGPLDDPAKPVAIVIEQRQIAASRFSPDEEIPVDLSLVVWVVVDASLGDDYADVEDRLEDAAETMIRLLEPLRDTGWDGTATREAYDDQKPAYQFPISAVGAITLEE